MSSSEPQKPPEETGEGTPTDSVLPGEADMPPEDASGSTAAEAVVESDAKGPEQTNIQLSPGTALNAAESRSITSAYPTQLVVFAGSEDSGKTTLLLSIYESLNKGPFADYLFAGSRSLVGFERECHLNRLASRQNAPDTERTKPSEQGIFYHLSLLDCEGNRKPGRQEVLFTAVSGELFRSASDSTEGAKALTFLKRADVLAVLVDGEKLAKVQARQQAVSDAQTLLQSLLDADMVAPEAIVEFVFSKHDCIKRAGDDAEEFQDDARQRLIAAFADRLSTIGFRLVAARPAPESDLPFADGVATALRSWLSPCESVRTKSLVSFECPNSEREFAQYGRRQRLRMEKQT